MQTLVWTDERPTAAGLYLWRKNCKAKPSTWRVKQLAGRDFIYEIKANGVPCQLKGGQFAGPLLVAA